MSGLEPGMTRQQVVGILGRPDAVRSNGRTSSSNIRIASSPVGRGIARTSTLFSRTVGLSNSDMAKLEIGAHRSCISRRSRFSTLEPSTLAIDGHGSASPRSEQDSPTVHERWRTWANITKMSGFVVTFVVTAPFFWLT